MIIKILGSGCKKCVALARNVETAAAGLGLEVNIEKVTDIVDIAGFGILSTPGLVIDNQVVSSGRVLTVSQVEQLLSKT